MLVVRTALRRAGLPRLAFVCVCVCVDRVRSLTCPRMHLSFGNRGVMTTEADGYRVIYDRETPFELRLQDSEDGPQEVGTLEPIKVKILILVSRGSVVGLAARGGFRSCHPAPCSHLTAAWSSFHVPPLASLLPSFFLSQKGDDMSPHSLRIELSSENDLFFHYMHVIDEAGFRQLQERQKLMVGFPEYPNVLIRMLNNAIKEPHRCERVSPRLSEEDGSRCGAGVPLITRPRGGLGAS